MRLGKVKVNIEYVVDLDNFSMVEEAKDCLVEDVFNAVKFDEVEYLLEVKEDSKNLKPNDIPEFLKGL